jgi:3-phenylpropionate/cinnamic acid dioxygenase small subunit
MVKNQQQYKEEETKRLIQFVNDNNHWVDNLNFELYLSQGAEQSIYWTLKNRQFQWNQNFDYQA